MLLKNNKITKETHLCTYICISSKSIILSPYEINVKEHLGMVSLKSTKLLAIYFTLSGGSLLSITAKLLRSCPALCDPIDSSPPGSPVPGILQARTLEWVAISSSNAWRWKVKVKSLSCVWLSAAPWTAAYQAPASMGFSRQEYWSGVPLPSLTLGGANELLLPLIPLQNQANFYVQA